MGFVGQDLAQCIRRVLAHHPRPCIWLCPCCVFARWKSRHLCDRAWFGKAKIWCADTGQCMRTLAVSAYSIVINVAFSPDGNLALTVAADALAKIWLVESGKCLHILDGHRQSLNSAVFSPDGSRVLTATNLGFAKIWCAESGNCLQTLTGSGFRGRVNSAVFF